ncbi:MAG: dephospho-CoA kinase [Francisellaceae bacterium]
MYAIGLTGGIASGKSTVANLFHVHHHIDIISADEKARRVIKMPEIIGAIAKRFGQTLVDEDGQIKRTRLREIIIHNSGEREWLNQLMHPLIRQLMYQHLLQSKSPYTIIDIPLLSKDNLASYPYLQKIITVNAPLELRVNRIMTRDNQIRAEAIAIIRSQNQDEDRDAIADFIVINDRDIAHLRLQVDHLHAKIMSML